MPERAAYLALGSNIEPLRHVRLCLHALRALPGVHLTDVSPCYRSSPWGGETDTEFVNLAVALHTALPACELLARTQHIEHALGRTRARRYAARTIDIDLLLIGTEQHQRPELIVPHPGLLERDFMLLPLLDIAPDLRHPATGMPLAAARAALRHRHIIGSIQCAAESSD